MADGTYEAVGEAMAADARRRSALTPLELAREDALSEIDRVIRGMTEARKVIAGFEDECASRPNTDRARVAGMAASFSHQGDTRQAREKIYAWHEAVKAEEEAARRAKFARAAQ